MRTPGGHRTYGPRQVHRLRNLKELVERFGIGPSDVAFELRLRTDTDLAHALDEWFGAVHRVAAPPSASFYRRMADEHGAATRVRPSISAPNTVRRPTDGRGRPHDQPAPTPP